MSYITIEYCVVVQPDKRNFCAPKGKAYNCCCMPKDMTQLMWHTSTGGHPCEKSSLSVHGVLEVTYRRAPCVWGCFDSSRLGRHSGQLCWPNKRIREPLKFPISSLHWGFEERWIWRGIAWYAAAIWIQLHGHEAWEPMSLAQVQPRVDNGLDIGIVQW